MDTPEITADDPEQQWIAKYRKAMEAAAIQIQQTRGDNFRDAIAGACLLLSEKLGKLLRQWIHPSKAGPVTVSLAVARVQKVAIPPRSMRRAARVADTRMRAS